MNKRNVVIIVGVLVGLLAVVFGVMLSQRGQEVSGVQDKRSGPKITISPDEYDWGDIQIDEKALATFTVTNSGDENLLIYRISTSCACTKASFTNSDTVSDVTIESGDSETLEVVFDPQFHDDQVLGEVVREVYIKTNDPDKSEVTIPLIGILVDN